MPRLRLDPFSPSGVSIAPPVQQRAAPGYIGMSGASTEITRAASTKGYVNHGATAGTARPTGYASIEWYGSVTPSNAVIGDTWVNTA
jgi:hypothetical protein